jgi:hypothetical protein
MVADSECKLSFSESLFYLAAYSYNFENTLSAVPATVVVDCLGTQPQYRFEQADLRVSYLELRGMNAYCDCLRPGIDVVSGQRSLVLLVEGSVLVQCQRVSWYDDAVSDSPDKF